MINNQKIFRYLNLTIGYYLMIGAWNWVIINL
jgi:hypothetical protein